MNGSFFLQETWVILGSVTNYLGELEDIATGATIEFRLDDINGAWTLTGTGTPTAALGAWELRVQPGEQAAVTPGIHPYEVRVTFSDGSVSIQNSGTIRIKPSRFAV